MYNNILESLSDWALPLNGKMISVCIYGDTDLSLQKYMNTFPKSVRFWRSPSKESFMNHYLFFRLKFLENLKTSLALLFSLQVV